MGAAVLVLFGSTRLRCHLYGQVIEGGTECTTGTVCYQIHPLINSLQIFLLEFCYIFDRFLHLGMECAVSILYVIHHVQLIQRAAVCKGGNIFRNLCRCVAVDGLPDGSTDGITVCPAGLACGGIGVKGFHCLFLIGRRCHSRAVFVQLYAGIVIQTKRCHVFIQRGNCLIAVAAVCGAA